MNNLTKILSIVVFVVFLYVIFGWAKAKARG